MAGSANAELIPVYVIMKDQPDHKNLMNLVEGRCKADKRKIVINYLKEIRDRSQKRTISYLEIMKEEGKVERIRSLWLGNTIYLKATNEVINEIAKFPEVGSIDWNEKRKLVTRPEGLNPMLPFDREIVWNLVRVRAPQVWALGYTGAGIIVSVIDSGVRYTHQDLADHIWINSGEIPNNGVDDDNNGYIDDYYGYDFINIDGDPMEDFGHGTHCAGTVAGDGTAGSQTGVAPDGRIMSLKVLDDEGWGDEATSWEAMQYAIENGAQVISMSLSWDYYWVPDRFQWRNICNTIYVAGIPMSVAAGNWGDDPPRSIGVPGDVPPPMLHQDQQLREGMSAVVTVGAIDVNDAVPWWSGRGPATWMLQWPWNDYEYILRKAWV